MSSTEDCRKRSALSHYTVFEEACPLFSCKESHSFSSFLYSLSAMTWVTSRHLTLPLFILFFFFTRFRWYLRSCFLPWAFTLPNCIVTATCLILDKGGEWDNLAILGAPKSLSNCKSEAACSMPTNIADFCILESHCPLLLASPILSPYWLHLGQSTQLHQTEPRRTHARITLTEITQLFGDWLQRSQAYSRILL